MLMNKLIATTALAIVLAYPVMSVAATTPANSAQIQSEKLVKASIRNPQGERLGDVEGVLMDKAGKTQAVIVDVGGFLGIGEHRVALNWDDVQVTASGDRVVSRYSKDQLKGLPEYKYPNTNHHQTVFYDPAWAPIPVMSTAEAPYPVMPPANWEKVTGEIHAKNLVSARVRSGENDIGSVDDAVIDASGRLKTIVVDVGGFLGIGSHRVALDYARLGLSHSGNDLRLTTVMTKDELKALPEYKGSLALNNAPRTTGLAAR